MKRISFLILVFMFTTAGFFKSDLENCADMLMKEERQFTKTAEYKTVEMTDSEKLTARTKWEKDKKKCETTNRCIQFYFDYNYYKPLKYPPTKKEVKIRDIPKKETERAYKKFISRSLKKKMNEKFSGYSHNYAECINHKKWNPELFKAKYD